MQPQTQVPPTLAIDQDSSDRRMKKAIDIHTHGLFRRIKNRAKERGEVGQILTVLGP